MVMTLQDGAEVNTAREWLPQKPSRCLRGSAAGSRCGGSPAGEAIVSSWPRGGTWRRRDSGDWKMWSGLLPPDMNESDVDLSADEGDPADGPVSCSKEDKVENVKGVQVVEFQTNRHERITESKSAPMAVADGENKCQECPSGVSLKMWNKFQELQKKSFEMKVQTNQGNRGQKRKRYRKEKLKKNKKEAIESQQSTNESQWKELTQYIGINDRFESLASNRGAQKSGLEVSIDKSLAEGDIERAEELSNRLATRELGVKIAKAVACRNFVKAKQDMEASQEARKKKKLAWGFEAKKRWETKSNMGYM